MRILSPMKRKIAMRLRICFILLLLLCCTGCKREVTFSDDAVLGERIVIDGLDVSGMTVAAAREALETVHKTAIEDLSYNVDMGASGIISVSGESLSVQYDTETVLQEALSLYPHATAQRTLSTSYSVQREGLRAKVAAIVKEYDKSAQNAMVNYANGEFTYTEEVVGCSTDVVTLANDLAKAIEAGNTETVIVAVRNEIPADYTLAQAQADTALIAQFSTSFSGSTYSKANRVYNIKKAASLINGYKLEPGATFDMNAVLGDRNAKNGWKEATGIKYGAYVQEYGGGVCQVSSTLYNVVLMADLTVTERQHHSWPLGYVDIGRDATISTGGPNFCFVNSSQAPVFITASVDEKAKTITVRIYGRPLADGVTIKLSSKKTGSIENPGDEIRRDASLPAGTRVVERESRAGSTAETYKLYYDAQGNLLKKELVTRDKYPAIKGIIYVSSDLY